MDTDAMKNSVQPLKAMASSSVLAGAFRLMGAVHSVEACARRYVSALTEDDFPVRFPSGSVLGSPSSLVPFHIGAAGPLTDQTGIWPAYGDVELQAEAARAVRAKSRASRERVAEAAAQA